MHMRYELDIDHGRTLTERIGDGRYDYVDPYITPSNFPTPPKGRVTTQVFLVPLGHVMTTAEVMALHREIGLRPATIHELLALGAAHPELQRQHRIAAFGSSCIDQEGPPSVPTLCSIRDGSRDLYLDWTEYRWSGKYHILGVPA